MKKSVLLLMAALLMAPSLSGSTALLPEIMKPRRLYVDRDQVFITEGAAIYIYSLITFRLQNKFGKRGEGPGEFKESGEGVSLIFNTDAIRVISSGRISVFTRDGRFIREQIVSDPRRFEFQVLGDRYAGTALQVEKRKVFFAVNLYDSAFKKLKELHRYPHPFFPRHKPINPVDLRVCTYQVYQNRLYHDDANGSIHVLDANGRERRVITHDCRRLPITENQKTRYLEFFKSDLKPEYDVFHERIKFPDRFPCIRNFHVQNERIYIITFEENGVNSRILIFNLQGKLLKKSWAPLAGINMLIPQLFNYYTIYRDQIFVLRENDRDEQWELIIGDL